MVKDLKALKEALEQVQEWSLEALYQLDNSSNLEEIPGAIPIYKMLAAVSQVAIEFKRLRDG